MDVKLEASQDGCVWIGGRVLGKTCERAWNGELWNYARCGDKEVEAAYLAASSLARLVYYLGRVLTCVQEGRFDRRYSQCVAKNSAAVQRMWGLAVGERS